MILRALASLTAVAAWLAAGCASAPDDPEPFATPGAFKLPEQMPPPDPVAPDETLPEIPPGDMAELLESRSRDDAYSMRAGDVIGVTVYDHADLSITLRIPGNGVGNFPLIGDIRIAGRTVDEVGAEIRGKLEKEYVALAPVSVMVREYCPCSAYILGRVSQPGAYEFPTNRPLSLLQLIAKAKGFLGNADTKKIRLIRGMGEKRRYWILSFEEIERAGKLRLDVELMDGDSVIVPELPGVHILGCVRNPGAIPAESGEKLSLARAIAKAGGFVSGADQETILVYRVVKEGERAFSVAFGSLRGAKEPPKDIPLYPGDTVFVRSADKVYVMGEVNQPGGFTLNEEGLSATKAVALAGGLTRRAEANGTVIVRFGPQGRSVIRVPVRSIVGGSDEGEVMLAPGDIVYVPERFF